jgi:hypothetical protein
VPGPGGGHALNGGLEAFQPEKPAIRTRGQVVRTPMGFKAELGKIQELVVTNSFTFAAFEERPIMRCNA